MSSTEIEIRKTRCISADTGDEVMHFEHFHIEVAQPPAGEVEPEES